MRGLVIAGTHSGCGKTTVSLGLMAVLKRRGMAVAPFKAGPDFIDPGHHTEITGAQSRNLDGWMLSRAVNRDCFFRQAQQADVAVVEGVMGLFDGLDGETESGSTAQMAKWLGLPVLLVVNAKSMARSAAALVQGFENFDKELRFCGVLFNNVAGESHFHYLAKALEGAVSMPCLGWLRRDQDVSIPERHLGLLTAGDHRQDSRTVDRLANLVEAGMDLDALLESLPGLPRVAFSSAASRPRDKERPRIAVARDKAFCFYYPENLEMLEECGAEIAPFSPLRDKALPENTDGLHLGGGYPELHAQALAANASLREQIRRLCRENMPIYGECGGFMYLCRTLKDLKGRAHPMTGCFDFTCAMASRLQGLGYREITLARDTVIGPAGMTARGHEFHYSAMESAQAAPVYQAADRSGAGRNAPGFMVNRCLGGYVHLHFKSQPMAPRAFVNACRQFRAERRQEHAAAGN